MLYCPSFLLYFQRYLWIMSFFCRPTYISAVHKKRSAISYQLNQGRFGDNLKSFAQVYWLAYVHHVPFLWSQDLKLHTVCASDIMQHLKLEHAARITIQYRQDNSHDMHVLEDFFALQKAQYLIRPKSNFSLYAQLLGDQCITISPARVKQGNPWGVVKSLLVQHNGRQEEILLTE